MLERGDARSIESRLKFPQDFKVDFESESLKRLSLGELRSGSFPFARLYYAQISDLGQHVPYLSLEDDFGDFIFNTKGIRVSITFKSDFRLTIGGPKEKEDKVIEDTKLRQVSDDANLIAGLLIGRMGMKNEDIVLESVCRFEKEHLFSRGFAEHFNQSFLAKLNVKEVPEIVVKVEEDFAGIPCMVAYDLTQGEKKDSISVTATSKKFSPFALDIHLNEFVKKTNGILELLGGRQ